MKYSLLLLFLGILASCSKPGADTTSTTDSTANNSSVQSPNAEPITLTTEEMERVNLEIFFMFHNEQLFGENPEVMAYKEDFTTTGSEFTYVILRHNGSRAGWHTVEQPAEEEQAPDPYGESDPYGETDPYGESEGEPEEIYTNEIDTVEIKGRYMAFLVSAPESTSKMVKIILSGSTKLVNYPYESYGEIKSYVDESPLTTEINVELSAPRQFDRHELYVKSKIADLTEQDLAGFSKDQLTILRNEIFARHGHTFKTDKMITMFGQMDWYHSLVDDAQSLLNKFEKRNVDFIKKREG